MIFPRSEAGTNGDKFATEMRLQCGIYGNPWRSLSFDLLWNVTRFDNSAISRGRFESDRRHSSEKLMKSGDGGEWVWNPIATHSCQ